jgi:hypothetical protein
MFCILCMYSFIHIVCIGNRVWVAEGSRVDGGAEDHRRISTRHSVDFCSARSHCELDYCRGHQKEKVAFLSSFYISILTCGLFAEGRTL